jgi:iron complex outermembrane receptor protein
MRRRLICVMAGAVMALSMTFAQAEIEDSSNGFFDEFPIVLSASRLMQKVDEAPATVMVIDRDLIVASGAREIADLFRLVPGMVVGQYKGHQPILGFHGLADPYFRQLQVLIDGVSIYSPVWGGADWSQLPIAVEDVERIEVVRGPNAATFGANAFLGVVNIITRDPAAERGAELISNFGENGIRDNVVRYASGTGDYRYRITAGQKADYGLDAYPDSRRTNIFNARGHLRLSVNDEFRWQLGYAGGTQGQGVDKAPNHTDGPRTSHFDSGMIQLRWTRSRDVDNEAWIQLSHAERSHREVLPYILTLPGIGDVDYPLDFGYRYRRTDLELQNTIRLSDYLRGVWGAQARQDGARSDTYFNSSDWHASTLYRLFGNLDWQPLESWIVAGGALVERNSFTGTSISPSLAVSYRIVPDHTLRVRAAKARRTPTLYEQEFNWKYYLPPEFRYLSTLPLAISIMTVKELADEKGESRELAYLGRLQNENLHYEMHLFEHRLDDLLRQYEYPYPTLLGGEAKGFDNLTDVVIRGRSLALRWRPWRGGLVYANASRTLTRAKGADAEDIEASSPRHTTTVLVSQELPQAWHARVAYYRVGKMQALSGGNALPATERIDVGVGRQFRLAPSVVADISLMVQNANGGIPTFEPAIIDRRASWLHMRIAY